MKKKRAAFFPRQQHRYSCSTPRISRLLRGSIDPVKGFGQFSGYLGESSCSPPRCRCGFRLRNSECFPSADTSEIAALVLEVSLPAGGSTQHVFWQAWEGSMEGRESPLNGTLGSFTVPAGR
ncbi:hypothetical protein AAFF_G00304050 [Aldrovandia affinis]|uniref:Uncharacterized protein n=1 Tax=Aldrovandia affinis TaxID=143900 RepID=A0AAD7SP65_9TELE|nr:hypothetical protein AAFF_G00304050 [Aldrovandia affinis]